MRATRSRFALVAGALLLSAPPGSAQDDWQGGGVRDLWTPHGEYVLLGGGVAGFARTAERNAFHVGGTWDVRLGFGSRIYAGAELAYVGSFRRGVASGPDLLANGAEAVVRVHYPYARRGWLVEPFVFGGFGWSYLTLRGAPAGVDDTDTIGVVPFGAGVTLGWRHLLVDARFTYRKTFNEDLQFPPFAGERDLQQWAAGAAVGWEF